MCFYTCDLFKPNDPHSQHVFLKIDSLYVCKRLPHKIYIPPHLHAHFYPPLLLHSPLLTHLFPSLSSSFAVLWVRLLASTMFSLKPVSHASSTRVETEAGTRTGRVHSPEREKRKKRTIETDRGEEGTRRIINVIAQPLERNKMVTPRIKFPSHSVSSFTCAQFHNLFLLIPSSS